MLNLRLYVSNPFSLRFIQQWHRFIFQWQKTQEEEEEGEEAGHVLCLFVDENTNLYFIYIKIYDNEEVYVVYFWIGLFLILHWYIGFCSWHVMLIHRCISDILFMDYVCTYFMSMSCHIYGSCSYSSSTCSCFDLCVYIYIDIYIYIYVCVFLVCVCIFLFFFVPNNSSLKRTVVQTVTSWTRKSFQSTGHALAAPKKMALTWRTLWPGLCLVTWVCVCYLWALLFLFICSTWFLWVMMLITFGL